MILVSGGAGVMGSCLVKGLCALGNKVRVLTLPNDPYVTRLDGTGCEIVYGDVSDHHSLEGVFDGIQTVYHLAAVIIAHDEKIYERINVQGTRNMVKGAVDAGVDHFIYISSAAVTFPHASAYARSKSVGEDIVRSQNRMHYTIVRPTLVYDENGGQEFVMFRDYLRKFPIVPFVGRGQQKKSPVFVEDLVQGLVKIANAPITFGKIYNFSGGETITIWDFAKLILKQQGISKPFLPIPIPVCKGIALIMEKIMPHPPLTRYAITRMEQHADLDNTLAQKDLGYNPVGVVEGFQKCFSGMQE